jgi:hypothetical protein
MRHSPVGRSPPAGRQAPSCGAAGTGAGMVADGRVRQKRQRPQPRNLTTRCHPCHAMLHAPGSTAFTPLALTHLQQEGLESEDAEQEHTKTKYGQGKGRKVRRRPASTDGWPAFAPACMHLYKLLACCAVLCRAAVGPAVPGSSRTRAATQWKVSLHAAPALYAPQQAQLRRHVAAPPPAGVSEAPEKHPFQPLGQFIKRVRACRDGHSCMKPVTQYGSVDMSPGASWRCGALPPPAHQ